MRRCSLAPRSALSPPLVPLSPQVPPAGTPTAAPLRDRNAIWPQRPPCLPPSLPPSLRDRGAIWPQRPPCLPASLPPCLPPSGTVAPFGSKVHPNFGRQGQPSEHSVSRGDSEEAKVDPRLQRQGRPDEREAPVPPAGTRRRAVLQPRDGCAVSTT